MRCEVPVCTRCCFCLPLRYGLAVWGYLNLLLTGALVVAVCIILNDMAECLRDETRKYKPDTSSVVIASIVLVVLLIGFALALAFIVGCHTKNVKLMRIYYIAGYVLIAIVTLICIFNLCLDIYYLSRYFRHYTEPLYWSLNVMESLMLFANVGVLVYIQLLLRSEMIKLNNNAQFQFVNLTAEADCNSTVVQSVQPEKNNYCKRGVDSDDEVKIYV